MNFDLRKIDIYNFISTDEISNIDKYIVGKSIENNEERYIIPAVNINPQEEETNIFFKESLLKYKSVESRTIGIDYKLLTDDKIEIIKEAYQLGTISGIRLLPEGKLLTKEIYDKFNNSEFQNFMITADGISSQIDLNTTYLDIRNQKGLVKIEKTKYSKTIEYTNKQYDNTNIHITRHLTASELKDLASAIKQNQYNNILVDFYDPTYYKKLISTLTKYGISENIKYVLLGNPLYDEISCYAELNQLAKNQIQINYNTCNDLNDCYREEPYSEGVHYYSDIEASGETTISNYCEMIKKIDEIVRHMEEKNYSPLEKVAYLYDYFKDNFIYDPNYITNPHNINADLDKVYKKDRMVCEGFSNFFSAILRRANVLCFTYGTDNHQKNIARIKDKKYNVDNIALLDITNDIYDKNKFNNFLVPFSKYLETTTPEVISIPTSFLIDQQTYEDYIAESNPVYATDPLGYGVRMLQLMGLTHGDKEFKNPKDYYNFYRNALKNSGLLKPISENSCFEAIKEVRKQENKQFDSNDINATKESLLDKNFGYFIPQIKLLNGEEIFVNLHDQKTNDEFIQTDSQIKILYRPRDKFTNESEEDYNKYLQDFYYQKFIKGESVPKIEKENTIEIKNKPNKPKKTIKNKKYNYHPMTEEEIKNSQDNVNNSQTLINDEFEQEEYILNTEILKPRERKTYESDEEYVIYLMEFYAKVFPPQKESSKILIK